jgi:predicted ester cyclase
MKRIKHQSIRAIAIALVFLLSCRNQASDKSTADYILNQNKEIARAAFTSIDKKDFTGLNNLLSDDFALTESDSDQRWSKDDLLNGIRFFQTSFPDWTHEINEIFAEGNKVIIRLTGQGTHKSEYESIPPTNKKVKQSAVHIMTISNQKIIAWWALEDNYMLMIQLGREFKPIAK